jgi:DNA repair protein RadC
VCEYKYEEGRELPDNESATIRGPEDIKKYLPYGWFRKKNEHFWVLAMNTRHKIINKKCVSIGTINMSLVHPREMFTSLIRSNAAAFIMVHNHPSGDAKPSPEDLTLTKRIAECGELMGIMCLDHVIIAGEDMCSIREYGWPTQEA